MLQPGDYFIASQANSSHLRPGKVINQKGAKLFCIIFMAGMPPLSTAFFKKSLRETIRTPNYFKIKEKIDLYSIGQEVNLYRIFKSGKKENKKGVITGIEGRFYIVETDTFSGMNFDIYSLYEYGPEVLEDTNCLYTITGKWEEK